MIRTFFNCQFQTCAANSSFFAHKCLHLEQAISYCLVYEWCRIEGLSNCLKLKEILLHNNCITRISNLSHLTNLRVLWLANNLIRWVDGLENLQLKELNLARNPLTQLGNILKVKSLKYLNVSATDIGSFKVISVFHTYDLQGSYLLCRSVYKSK